jgi:hypothetical protein
MDKKVAAVFLLELIQVGVCVLLEDFPLACLMSGLAEAAHDAVAHT